SHRSRLGKIIDSALPRVAQPFWAVPFSRTGHFLAGFHASSSRCRKRNRHARHPAQKPVLLSAAKDLHPRKAKLGHRLVGRINFLGSFQLRDRRSAALTDRRITGILANVRRIIPAALALLSLRP